MQKHIASTYHCITCGRIEHAEHDAAPPQCCGRTMTESIEETTPASEIAGGNNVGESAPDAPANKDLNKPR